MTLVLYDDFLFGGYGKSNQQLRDFIYKVAKNTGVVLDDTYTGKAFWGMIQIIKNEKLRRQHAFLAYRGLLNLMA